MSDEKDTKQVLIMRTLHARVEAAASVLAERLGFKPNTSQAIGWLINQGLQALPPNDVPCPVCSAEHELFNVTSIGNLPPKAE